jgi:hypothetical protein
MVFIPKIEPKGGTAPFVYILYYIILYYIIPGIQFVIAFTYSVVAKSNVLQDNTFLINFHENFFSADITAKI